jgi:hypothetical protein
MAKELVSMKIDKAAREKRYAEPATLATDAPEYPWGVRLQLSDEELEKLGIDTLPAIESEVLVYAKAMVVSTSVEDSAGGPARKSLSLQITDLCLEAPGASKKSDAEAIFGKG